MIAEPRMRKSAAVSIAVAAVMLSGTVAHADTQSPAPSPPPGTPKCLTFDGQPPLELFCGWTTGDFSDGWKPPASFHAAWV